MTVIEFMIKRSGTLIIKREKVPTLRTAVSYESPAAGMIALDFIRERDAFPLEACLDRIDQMCSGASMPTDNELLAAVEAMKTTASPSAPVAPLQTI